MAIQLIINKGFKNENPIHVLSSELTDLVEAAVLLEFDRTERRGVLGAMETMYQRSKIQKKVCIMKH
jgi:methylmalonyl-CoA mutase